MDEYSSKDVVDALTHLIRSKGMELYKDCSEMKAAIIKELQKDTAANTIILGLKEFEALTRATADDMGSDYHKFRENPMNIDGRFLGRKAWFNLRSKTFTVY